MRSSQILRTSVRYLGRLCRVNEIARGSNKRRKELQRLSHESLIRQLTTSTVFRPGPSRRHGGGWKQRASCPILTRNRRTPRCAQSQKPRKSGMDVRNGGEWTAFLQGTVYIRRQTAIFPYVCDPYRAASARRRCQRLQMLRFP
jgi:hypothetical protein